MNGFKSIWLSLSLAAIGVFSPTAVRTAKAQTATPVDASPITAEDATVTGFQNVILVTHLPVQTASGVKYFDLAIPLTVLDSSTGLLAIVPPGIQQSPSSASAPGGTTTTTTPGPSSFYAGTYNGSNNYSIIVSGNSAGNVWSLAAAPNASYSTYPSSAVWYTGSNSPIAARVTKAGITSTAFVFGTAGGAGNGNDWPANGLLGFAATISPGANGATSTAQLVIASFTDTQGDHNAPVATITYTATGITVAPSAADVRKNLLASPAFIVPKQP